jgi:hypothetical protein
LVEALYDYEATSPEDLSFKEHQIIKVTEHSFVFSPSPPLCPFDRNIALYFQITDMFSLFFFFFL